MGKRLLLTNEIVDQRLSGRQIVRHDNVINASTKINWECIKCNFIWLTTPNNIFSRKTGCPKCAGTLQLSNIDVDNRIQGRNLIRLENIENNATKIKWQCSLCNYIWKTTASKVLNQKTGCPKCAEVVPLTNELIDHRLFNRKIIRIGNVSNALTNIDWQCHTCNHIWIASPNNILNHNSGCPICRRNISKLEEQWLDYLGVLNTIATRQVRKALGGKRYTFDGFIVETNTVYEFNGDSWHGNPQIYNAMDINPVTKTTYNSLHACYLEKKKRIFESGFTLIEIWENDWLSTKHELKLYAGI